MKSLLTKIVTTLTVVSASGLAVFANTQILSAQMTAEDASADSAAPSSEVIPQTEEFINQDSATPTASPNFAPNGTSNFVWSGDDDDLVDVEEIYEEESAPAPQPSTPDSPSTQNPETPNPDLDEAEEEEEEEEESAKPIIKPTPKPKPDTDTGASEGGSYEDEEDEEEEEEEDEEDEEEDD